MDRYDRHRGGDRYSSHSSSEEAHHYSSGNKRGFSSSRFSDGGGAPFNHNRPESYRGGGGGGGRHSSPRSYRGGGGREHHRPFDSPPRYRQPHIDGEGGGGLRPFGDEIGRFPPGGGYPPIGGGGYRSMGGDVGPIDGGRADDGRFPPIGGDDDGRFRPMVGAGDDGRFRPMAGGGDDGRFRPMGGGANDGRFGPIGGGGGGDGRFGAMGGGGGDDDGRFGPMGADDGRFRPMGGGADGGEFGQMGGSGDGGRFHHMDSGADGRRVGIGADGGGGFQAGPVGGHGGGLRPVVGGDVGGFGRDNYQMPPPQLTGQKRGYPFSDRERSPERLDGASFAKLFVGSVPRTVTEEDIRPLFDQHGHVLEVALIKDKRTGQQQGCCFIKYATSEEADRAIRALHNQYTLPGGVAPIQVRYADGERERLGATEYKLFVGAMNKQATEKEIEEVFSPYGKVEDVYLMRDEMKQSRGCGFVKYSQHEMAQAAIDALNGTYTMRGCNQPLTVRFAEPKKPRPGESRVVPAFGNPGFLPPISAPGVRPPPNLGEPLHGQIPPNSWPPVSPHNLRPPSNIHGFNSQLPARSGDMPASNTPGHLGGLPGNPDGSRTGSSVSSAPNSQNYHQSFPQVPASVSTHSPVQRPIQSPLDYPPAQHLPRPNAASSPNMQNFRGPHMQHGQVQMPYGAVQNPYRQVPPSQQLPGPNSQLPPVAQPQRQYNTTPAPGQAPVPNQQQLPPIQELPQPPSAQMLSQQKQTLQATFQSSQQAFNQLQQQLQQLQPSNQHLTSHQGPPATKQQAPWSGMASQPVTGTASVRPGGDLGPTASSAVSTLPPNAAVSNCTWSEHTSPDGYKYYYNSVTGESKWEKPEELKVYEQQQQQQQHPQPQTPASQFNQVERQPQGPAAHHAPQTQLQFQGQQQPQLQNQIRPFQPDSQSSFQAPGLPAKQGTKELGYAQIPAGNAIQNNPTRYQQAPQEWMWKNKPSGT